MQKKIDRSNARNHTVGRLTFVGSGITAIAHLTLETIGHVKNADIVFYNATSGVTATYVRELNPNAVDLYEYYDEGKPRSITYVQMAELMLREVRLGRSVVGLLHGHPGYFVKAARRALAIAEMEGHETLLLPGISATDCLFADLRIDPGVIGVQILKASHILCHEVPLALDNHVVVVQVGSVGDNTFSFTGFKHAKIDRLFDKLISIYGEEHDSVYYVASIFPGLDPVITVRKLGEYRLQKIQDTVHAATLYLPPAGIPFAALTNLQAFENNDPYGRLELKAIADLAEHKTPAGFKRRGSSKPMLRAMVELGTSPAAAFTFRKRPAEFLARHRDLSNDEREALLSREIGRLRSVTALAGPNRDEQHGASDAEPCVKKAQPSVQGATAIDYNAIFEMPKSEEVILEAYAVRDNPQPLVPAPPTRDWMDANRHAYRCLPLAAANTYGWQIVLPVNVTAEWNGGMELRDIIVDCAHPHQAVSNFKCGILTFDVGYIFRTSPGYHLLVTGPSNVFKDGIAPMAAVIETDWLPYTFTFNYRFTRPGRVQWQAGEPYAQICVVPGRLQESIQPVIRSLRDNPQLEADHAAWRQRRENLRARLAARDPAALRTPWDKDYFLGRYADGRAADAKHTSKARVRAPTDERRRRDPNKGRELSVRNESELTNSGQTCPPFTEFPKFASIEDCHRVIEAYERCREKFSHKVGDGFFDFRVLWINSFPAAENETRRILQGWRKRAVKIVSASVGQQVYSDTIQIVRWNGQAMPPHQDDRHPDGRPHRTPWRKWASVIYLNDDFEGGELFFPSTGECYRPSRGALIFFEGQRWHGVRAVTRGIRYTAPSWYSTDPAHEDRYAHIEY